MYKIPTEVYFEEASDNSAVGWNDLQNLNNNNVNMWVYVSDFLNDSCHFFMIIIFQLEPIML